MDPFKFRVLELGNRFVVLLPKLNHAQLGRIRGRLASLGYNFDMTNPNLAKKARVKIHFDPIGLCWSNENPTDAIAPVIPELLDMRKEPISIGDLKEEYFFTARGSRKATVRFNLRVESSTFWVRLRTQGSCGLTPDEHAVASYLLKSSSGEVHMITDFPAPGCTVRRFGQFRFYHADIDCQEAASMLRVVGRENEKNAYLPRDGVLTLPRLRVKTSEVKSLLEDLGEWCYFEP